MGLSDLLQGAIANGSPAGSNASSRPRAEMTFTSTLRLELAPGLGQNDARVRDAQSFFGSANVLPTIAMSVNPNSIKWAQSKRITKRDTRDGSVYFHFTNELGQNDDILVLQFTGNTGNIDLRGSLGDPNQPNASGTDTGALQKLLVWHNLFLLTREPMRLSDGTENVFTLLYTTKMFPVEITFNGFFSRPLEFDENAEKPNSLDYTMEFTVTSSTPELHRILEELTTVLGQPFQTTAPVALPASLGTVTENIA